jgi:hypothetical protein
VVFLHAVSDVGYRAVKRSNAYEVEMSKDEYIDLKGQSPLLSSDRPTLKILRRLTGPGGLVRLEDRS